MNVITERRGHGQGRLRVGRRSLPAHVYHVTISTHARVPWFADLYCGRAVVGSMQRLQDSGHAATLAYVVMPDHLHWLFKLGDKSSLSATIGSLKSQSARIINQTQGRHGRIWQCGYYDRVIRNQGGLIIIAKYLLANPIHAGPAERLEEYALWDSIWVRARSR